ncbi:MAG: squalene synthase HpnC [Ignavibacteria bacterium]|nr:squalene synthase HpnC [Ignavibacteria bacterium]
MTEYIARGYSEAMQLATSHYENFPVVSILIPKELRKHVAAIYWFARTADDIADEENFAPEERIKKLDAFRIRFEQTLQGSYFEPVDAALAASITAYQLPTHCFLDLISAFRQDIFKHSYVDLPELLNYCQRSANPVGRLMLALFGVTDPAAVEASDCICTALQLANFWQDVSIDIHKGRLYIPDNYLTKYGVSYSDIEKMADTPGLRACMVELLQYTEKLFDQGDLLLPYLHGRFKYEIIITILGGRKILAKIKKIEYTIARKRVKLHFTDIIHLLVKSAFYERRIGTRDSERK